MLSTRIKNFRKAAGFSQEALAKELFITRQTISKWETGKSEPSIAYLLQMADLFQISLDELVREKTKDSSTITIKQQIEELNQMKKETKELPKKTFWREYVIPFAIVFAIMMTARFTFFSPTEVEGVSMEPSLQTSDRLWKMTFKTPSRFDIVTFPSPRNEDNIVKRIIGLPGETVAYRNDQLYINGQKIAEPYLAAFKEALPAGETLTSDFTLETIEKGAQKTVPEGCYFVLGDNRRVADDSRYFGFVTSDRIKGVAYFRFWPLDRLGPL